MIRCTGCGAETIFVSTGDTVPGLADWFCSQACYERHRDAQSRAEPMGQVLPFPTPLRPREHA